MRLTGIHPDAYTTKQDKAALDALKRVPLLPQVLRKFHDLGLDRWYYCRNMAMSVRCGPGQMPSLYRIFREACRTLDVPEPELYVSNDPYTNAFAGGIERPYITVRSSVLDLLNDKELLHLFGHELAHIKSGHMLYTMVGMLLLPLLRALGRRLPIVGDVAAISLLLAFYDWMRLSEVSCDRAGLLVSQDFDASMMANLRLTVGLSRFSDEVSLDAFRRQARTYQDAPGIDNIGKVILFFTESWRFTHPMPVHRAQMLEKWYESGAYERILRGDFPKA
ncbi:MAG: hypothetical protein C4341_03585 [Armatimonadota bacterium]